MRYSDLPIVTSERAMKSGCLLTFAFWAIVSICVLLVAASSMGLM